MRKALMWKLASHCQALGCNEKFAEAQLHRITSRHKTQLPIIPFSYTQREVVVAAGANGPIAHEVERLVLWAGQPAALKRRNFSSRFKTFPLDVHVLKASLRSLELATAIMVDEGSRIVIGA